MQATEELIRSVVEQVLTRMGTAAPSGNGRGYSGRHGIFTCVDEAVAAATEAFEQLSERTIADRKRIIDHIRRISIDHRAAPRHEPRLGHATQSDRRSHREPEADSGVCLPV